MGLNLTNGLALLRQIINERPNVNVLFITGAGISVKSGVPLYRSDDGDLPTERKRSGPLEEVDPAALDNSSSSNGHHPFVDISSSSDGSSVPAISPWSILQSPLPREEARRRSIESLDLRLRQTAIWNYKLETLAQKMAFLSDPRAWYRYFWFDTHHVESFLQAKPNEVHYAIGMLCQGSPERFRCVTQNVDRLHSKAGCPKDQLIEVHGKIGIYRCSDDECIYGSEQVLHWYDLEFLSLEEERRLRKADPLDGGVLKSLFCQEARRGGSSNVDENFLLPCCPECRQPVMPMTLLFDEQYQTHTYFDYITVKHWVHSADVLIFMGTSFSVTFTELAISIARAKRKLVFDINPQKAVRAFAGFEEVFPQPDSAASDARDYFTANEDFSGLFATKDTDLLNEGAQFNWDSDASPSPTKTSPIRLRDNAPIDIDPQRLKQACIVRIQVPADTAILHILNHQQIKYMSSLIQADKLHHQRKIWRVTD